MMTEIRLNAEHLVLLLRKRARLTDTPEDMQLLVEREPAARSIDCRAEQSAPSTAPMSAGCLVPTCSAPMR